MESQKNNREAESVARFLKQQSLLKQFFRLQTGSWFRRVGVYLTENIKDERKS